MPTKRSLTSATTVAAARTVLFLIEVFIIIYSIYEIHRNPDFLYGKLSARLHRNSANRQNSNRIIIRNMDKLITVLKDI